MAAASEERLSQLKEMRGRKSRCWSSSRAINAEFRWPSSRRRGWRFTCNRIRRPSRGAFAPGDAQTQGVRMVSSSEILAAFREVSNSKQLDRSELYALLQDGILAALAKKYGPNVQAEVNIDDGKGDIRIVLLKTVKEVVEDPSREISVDDARAYDASIEAGDVMEEPIDFAVFGRAAVQA